ncbi:carbohydrate ABC transporter permease [Cohnella sp. LGH]|uniref:Multiple sugar transport system permease protein/putative aldouronate transport system permease protein n=1 Tax=Cohnella phaseoli TaxID=456490 RepID=A0A3D9KGN4_9BACL|nr:MULTISPECIES: carbohydrate ABC transporter permease [Cohnella]QTH41542.1 carbohydrate ABC transporter permease [Cohnella sp. LGH]RED85519.1 multiple sugar transport system permease protein/putative aldouronate transport system permease protein [Cohnella phaseoli]
MRRERFLDFSFHTLNTAFFALFALCCIYPFYYILINSVSDPIQMAKGIYLWPKGFSLTVYREMLSQKTISVSFWISSSRAVLGTILTVFSCALFSYLITKKEMPLRKTIYRFVVVTLYLNAGLIPWYLTMKTLGLKNNFLLYVLPSLIVGFFVILMKTFIEQIPAALEEAAVVEGAGYWTVFAKIIFPVSLPIVATITVFNAVNQWNSWMDNLFLVNDPSLQTLQLTLLNFLKQSEALAQETTRRMLGNQTTQQVISPQNVKMAITMIVTAPILLIYPFMQRYFVKGIMLGAVKG